MPPTGMRAAPTSPIGTPDLTGWGPSTGFLSELAETVPDLQWPESVRTYARMRRDAKLTAVLSAVSLPVLRASWAVDPAGVKNAKAVDLVAGDLGLPILGEKGRPADSPIRGFRWVEHCRLAMLSLVYGHFPTEKWFVQRDGLTHLAGWAERQPHTLAFIDVGDDGQITQVEQATQTRPIPANRLVWYCNQREGANWAGVSILRACYTPWILKHEVLRVHATSHRRWGMGVPVVNAPPGATPAQITEAQRLAAGFRAGDQAGAGLPDGFSFNLAGLTGSVPDAVAFINLLNQEMSGSALAGVIELGTTAYGARALGDTFLDLFLLALQAIADQIGAAATYGDPAMPGVSRALVDYNFGEDEPCPRIVAQDVGDRHEITAAAIQQLIASGAVTPDPELEAYIREAWGLPEHKAPPPASAPPGPPAPTAPGGAPGGRPPGPAQPAPQQPGPKAPAAQQSPAPPVAAAGPRRDLTDTEVAAGFDPEAIRRELDVARDRVLRQWAPVLQQQRADLADQVAAAVDDGHLARLASLSAPTADAAEVLYRAMAAQAARAAGRAVGEAAAQGITIDPARVRVDHDRLRQLAEARASLAAQQVTAAASRRALQVVTASAGTDAAQHVSAELAGLSVAPLADQLGAAMHAASAEGRFAVLDAGPDAIYVATEWASDPTCCDRCKEIDGHQFASLAEARAAYASGAYRHCQGGLRCRGTVVAAWPDPASLGWPGEPPLPGHEAQPGQVPGLPGPGAPPPVPTVLEAGDRLAGRTIGQVEPGDLPGSARVGLAGGGTVLLAPAGAAVTGTGAWSVTGTLPGARTAITLAWAGGLAGWPPNALAWAVDAMDAGQVTLDDGAALLAWLTAQGFTRSTAASGPPPFPADVPGGSPEAAGWDEARRPDAADGLVEAVGPKGYIHGWIFVGIPGVGYAVSHPHHGHGTVTEASDKHVQVSFDTGHAQAFPVRLQKGPGRFERMTDAELEHELRTAEGKRFFAAMTEIDRRDHESKAAQLRSLYAETPGTSAQRNRVYQRLVDLGENPEDAWAHVHGTDTGQMQQDAVTAQLRAQGYKGGGFDKITRDAYRHEVQRRTIQAEADTNGYMLNPDGKRAGIDPWSLFTGTGNAGPASTPARNSSSGGTSTAARPPPISRPP